MTKRQVQILKTLYKEQGYLTFQELAGPLGVSVKTVRNDIYAIREFLREKQLGDIDSKPRHGVRACINEKDWEMLFNSGRLDETDDEADKKIFFFIVHHLLKHASLTAQRLAQQYYISRTQLDKILETVNAWFAKNHIVFERRRGKGISILYSEFNYRLAFLNFYLEYKDYFYRPDAVRSSRYAALDDYEYTAMCSALDGFDVDNVAEAVAGLETRFGIRFSYTSDIMLLFLVSLCIIRQRKGKIAQVPQPRICKTDGLSDEMMSNALIEDLQERFSLKVPRQEQEFFLFVVMVGEIQKFENDRFRRTFEAANIELCQITVKFINLVSEITGVDLRDDRFFVTQMFLQLKAMIARLKYQTCFKNPLLRQIKAKYPNLMAAAWSAGNIFEKELQLDINEHEVAYLALHIGGAIERSSANLRACIVCDYGIGISQILREKIQRALPELKITSVFSNREIRNIKREACDLIISTIPIMDLALGKPIITVGHLLDSGDIEKIEQQIKKIRAEKRSFNTGAKHIKPAQTLFAKELVYPAYEATSKEELLHNLCVRLENLGYVAKGFERSVLEREKHTSTEVGEGIALPHGHSKYVNRSVAVFVKLAKPMFWFENCGDVDLVFLLAFDLDEEKGMKNEIIKFYKSFVGFIEDAQAQARLRELADRDEIIKLFENW